jgi:hypothetical protein
MIYEDRLRERTNNLLYKFADYVRHHENTGLGGPDNQHATTNAIMEAFKAELGAAIKEHKYTNVPSENLNAQEDGEMLGWNELADILCNHFGISGVDHE